MVDVRVLGQARVSGSATPGMSPSRTIELLTYFALHADAAIPRSHVAALFWPDSTEQQARTNLRREMHLLRQACGADVPVQSQGQTLGWQDSPGCRLDVRIFEREAAAARSAHASGDGSGFLTHAERAINEYGGELLPGAYSEWIQDERLRLCAECSSLCGLAARGWMEAGDLVRSLAAARLGLQLQPLEEAGYRTLMQVQLALGDRAAAMATFHRCATVLEHELGVAPDEATEELFSGLLQGVRQHRRANISVQGRRELIGREQEFRSLVDLWHHVLAGHPELVLLSGEAGVGKSRLTAEFAATLATDGASVCQARCFPSSGSIALSPVAQWLRCAGLRAAINSLDAARVAEVQRLVPDVGPDAAGENPPGELEPAGPTPWQRHRFFEGLARAVNGSGRPLLLILEDVQWCDAETLSWLDFLLRYTTGSRLLVLLNARPGELLDNAPASETLRRMRAAGNLTQLELAPFGPTDCLELAEALGGRALHGGEAQLMYAASGGYPMFIVEATRYLPDPEASGRYLESTDLQQLLRNRLDQLSTDARQTAALAAAVGTDFGLELVSAASEMDPHRVARSVDELWQWRILDSLNGDRYGFTHELFREAAYRTLAPAQRWLQHSRLAEALERLHPHGRQPVAGQLARHYRVAGHTGKELHYRMLAAEHAAGLFAYTEVLEHYGRALHLLPVLPRGTGQDQQELHIQRQRLAALSVVKGYAAPELRAALERTEELADRLGKAQVLLASLMGQFSIRFVHGDTTMAYRIGTRAVTMARNFPQYLGQAHFAVAGAALSMGRPHEAISHFQLAMDRREESVPSILGVTMEDHAEEWAAHACWLVGREDDALTMAARAEQRRRGGDSPFMLTVSLAYSAVLHQLRGDTTSLSTMLAELGPLCSRYQVAYYRNWWQILHGWMSPGDDGVNEIEDGIAGLRGQKAFARMPYWLSLLAEAKAERGQPEAARAVLDAAVVAAGQNDDRWWLPEVLRLRARLEPAAQRRQLLERALQHAVAQGSVVLERRCRNDLGGANDIRTLAT